MISRNKRKANVRIVGLLLGLGVLLVVLKIIHSGADVDLGWGKARINPKKVPTGDPIRVRLEAHLQPAGEITQVSEIIKIEFAHATFPDHKVGSVTLRVNKEQPQDEVSLTLPCASGYDYTIDSKSELMVGKFPLSAAGSAKGTIQCTQGKVLSCDIDPSETVAFLRRPPAQRIGAASYRPFFALAEQKK